jgi:hypothetical protein
MSRLDRPLNPDACDAADKRLYSAHENDRRPNDLFDTDGNRRPLTGSNHVLNEEWKDYYREEKDRNSSQANGDAAGGATSSDSSNGATAPAKFTNRAVSDPVQNCPLTHWIQIELVKHPDKTERPEWWPKAGKALYSYEVFKANLTEGLRAGALNGAASVRYECLPPGACTIQFPKFLDEIEAEIKENQ